MPPPRDKKKVNCIGSARFVRPSLPVTDQFSCQLVTGVPSVIWLRQQLRNKYASTLGHYFYCLGCGIRKGREAESDPPTINTLLDIKGYSSGNENQWTKSKLILYFSYFFELRHLYALNIHLNILKIVKRENFAF